VIDREVLANVPDHPVETGPIIDANRQRVYVYNNNYLYCLKYINPGVWSDTAYSSYTPTGTKHTSYQAAYMARPGEVGPRDANDSNKFVRNKVTPAPAFDFSSLYVVSHGRRSPSGYHVAISRIQPSRVGALATTNDLGGTDLATDTASANRLSTTVANSLASGAGGFGTSPYGSRVMLIDPYSDVLGKGGDLYLGFSDSMRVYRIGTTYP
jgi:hypothetical protein